MRRVTDTVQSARISLGGLKTCLAIPKSPEAARGPPLRRFFLNDSNDSTETVLDVSHRRNQTTAMSILGVLDANNLGPGEVMSSDYEKRLKALYQEACNEKDPEKLKQLISEILAVLEADQKNPRDREAESFFHLAMRRGRKSAMSSTI